MTAMTEPTTDSESPDLAAFRAEADYQDGRRPEKSEIGLNEMQSLDREFESNCAMQSLHRASFASAGEYDHKTAASPPLPLPLSPGNCPLVTGGGNLSSYRARG